MTDTKRDEVEHHARPDLTDLTVQEWAAYRCDDAGAVARKLLAENQSLRQRLEAAVHKARGNRLAAEAQAMLRRDAEQGMADRYREGWIAGRDAAAACRGAYMSDDADVSLLNMWRKDIRTLTPPSEGGERW